MIDIQSPHYEIVRGLLVELYSLPGTNSSDKRRRIYQELSKYSVSPQEAMDIRDDVIATIKEKSQKELKEALDKALTIRRNGKRLETSASTA